MIDADTIGVKRTQSYLVVAWCDNRMGDIDSFNVPSL